MLLRSDGGFSRSVYTDGIFPVVTFMHIAYDALTFDDVLLLPARSSVLPRDAELKTLVTQGVALNLPLLSAAMDTVTEAPLAIALALAGGMGVIHKNMSVESQAEQVRQVKKFESGIIRDPVTTTPDTTIRDVLALTKAHNISGVPVVQGNSLVGIVTARDLRFETNLDNPVSSIMTSREKGLITVTEHATQEQIIELLHKNRIEKVLVIDDDKSFRLKGLITVKDIQKNEDNPHAAKDSLGRLRVGAAVGVTHENRQRVDTLIEAGVDVLVVDTAHGHSQGVLDMIRWIRNNHPDAQILGGNIATGEAALDLAEAGVNGVKVGIGPGSICTTRIIAGVGVPQISAINQVAKALEGGGIPLVADGGIRFSGDVAKALVAGAHCVMLGNIFAGTDEAPGDIEIYQGRSYKSYRGMGSLGAMSSQENGGERYFQKSGDADKLVPEGIEGRVPYKGPVLPIIHQLMGGLRASMGYTGCKNLEEFRSRPQMVRITGSGITESHVHDITITKEAPNYPTR